MRRAFAALSLLALALGACLLPGCTWWPASMLDFDVSTTEGARPLPVAFVPRNDESAVSYRWDFGDGETSSDRAPIHIYREAGIYTVSLTAALIDGRTVSVTKPDAVSAVVLLQKATQRLYWIDWRTCRIMYTARSGGESGVLIDDLRFPTALATGGGFIYWADSGSGSIVRAKIDGSDRETLVTGLHRPASLAIDTAHAMLYCGLPHRRRL